MNHFCSLGRMSMVVAAISLFALAVPRASAGEVPFHAEGTFTFDLVGGNKAEVFAEGRASPGGRFTLDDFVSEGVERGVHFIEGTFTMVFASGSTLTIYYKAPIDDNNVVMGPYWVVGGTGHFAGATGYGTIWYPIGQGELFTLDGEIEF